VSLVIGSDGLAVGNGLDLERRVPSLAEARRSLTRAGVRIDLRRVSGTHLCGLHNIATTEPVADARSGLWSGLFIDWSGKPVICHWTCDNVYPPLPATLLAATEEDRKR